MEIFIEYIANHTWSLIVLAVLYIAYEIIVRRIPTDSPYWSIIHIVGKLLNVVGKAVLKIVGENISKKINEGADADATPTDKPKKLKRLIHK